MNWLIELIRVRRHNRNLYKTGRADRSKKVYTNIRPDLGEDPSTASGYVELSTSIERKEYGRDTLHNADNRRPASHD